MPRIDVLATSDDRLPVPLAGVLSNLAMRTSLNGWQRLWVVVAAAGLLAFMVYAVVMEFDTNEPDTVKVVFNGLLVWAGLLGAIYVVGFAVAWVRRGFTSEHS